MAKRPKSSRIAVRFALSLTLLSIVKKPLLCINRLILPGDFSITCDLGPTTLSDCKPQSLSLYSHAPVARVSGSKSDSAAASDGPFASCVFTNFSRDISS